MWIVYKKNDYIAGVFHSKEKAIKYQINLWFSKSEDFLIEEVSDKEIKQIARKILDKAEDI